MRKTAILEILPVITNTFFANFLDTLTAPKKGNLCVAMLGPIEIEQWVEAEDPTVYLDEYVGKAMLR
jgi:hypothetical protein